MPKHLSKKQLLEEKERLEKILARHAKKDPRIADNYIANYPQVETEDFEESSEVFEFSEGELNSDIVQKLELRLQKVNKELGAG